MEKSDYYTLLARQLSGELSESEHVALTAWLDASPEHRALAAQMRQVWESTAEAPALPALDLDADFQRVVERIEAGKAKPSGMRLVQRPRVWPRVAAAAAALIACVWGMRQMTTYFPAVLQQEQAVNTDVREIALPDGSRVWLRRNAVIEYPRSFDDDKRMVRLYGEAYFEVTHRPEQPFQVETAAGDRVEVLGTAFGVALSPNRENTEVLVRSGRVRFTPSGMTNSVELTAHQKAAFRRASAQLVLDRDASLNELAWQTGGLEFVRTPLSTVLTDLEKYYGASITLRNDALRTCRHTAPLTKQPLDKVLDGLALTYQFKIVHRGENRYELIGGTCH